MSRIARQPVPLSGDVTATLEGTVLRVKGAKGELATHVPAHLVEVKTDSNAVTVRAKDDTAEAKAASGLVRSLAANLVRGVSEEFTKQLEFKGVGYRAAVEGNTLKLNVGYSHPVTLEAPAGVSLEVKKNVITVRGADAQAVGQFAANVRAVRPPEPYKGKGIKYADETIRRKAGKAGKAGAE